MKTSNTINNEDMDSITSAISNPIKVEVTDENEDAKEETGSEFCLNNNNNNDATEIKLELTVNDNQSVLKCLPDSSSASIPKSQDLDACDNEDPDSIRQSILNLIEDIFHAMICRNSTCTRNNCAKMKWAMVHSKACRGRFSNPPCVPCTHLYMLLGYHAHVCRERVLTPRCKLLGCRKMKAHFKKTKLMHLKINSSRQSANPNDSTRSSDASEMSIANSTASSSVSLSSSICNSDAEITVLKADPDSSVTNPDTDTKPN